MHFKITCAVWRVFFHSLWVPQGTKSEVRWKIQAAKQTWPEPRQTAPGLCLKWASEKTECLRVMVGSRITVTLTHTGSLSHTHAWQSVCQLSSTVILQQRRPWGQFQKKTALWQHGEGTKETSPLIFVYFKTASGERFFLKKRIILSLCVSAACGVKARERLLSGISTCGCQSYQI